MFIHIAKDFMKKLEDVDARLAVSLDKDEIQTLGLKLRFYFNELKHYRARFDEIHDKIIDTQKKYGFAPEEDVPYSQPRPQPARPAPLTTASAPAPEAQEKPNTLKVLSEWVAQLEQQGQDPNKILANAGESARNAEIKSIDFNLPEEDPGQEPPPPPAPAPEPVIEEYEEPAPVKEPYVRHKQYAPPHPEIPRIGRIPENPEPEQPSGSAPMSIEEIFMHWGEVFEPSEKSVLSVIMDLRELAQFKKSEIALILDQALAGKKIIPDGKGAGLAAFCWGLLAHELGRNGQAVALLQQAISGGIAVALSYLMLGQACFAKGLYEKALINFKFASKIDPSLEESSICEAWSLLAMGKPQEAIDHLRGQRFATQEARADAAILQAEALEKMSRVPEAKSLLETAAQATPSHIDRARLIFRLASMLESEGDILSAISQYESAIESDLEHLPARFHLGRLYLQHQAFPLAREQFSYLIKKHPGSTWADKARELL